ncbi:tRNA(Ser) Um(44) 2'-O-methyltransferase [Emydomyces testavorans]|uniref:tRNA (uracil-O(2)-)-methyltransferase n=1 Tax=Emydomyces testavorans TaxID=2070801 RepID=A0AAF0DR35_9EURO|nr:tRNA(Ser) Um(44) 2'-O-methyltransferase [Emydomyces testavorans]
MGLTETLEQSILTSSGDNWITSPELIQSDLHFKPELFLGSATHLLANPNLTSSHLFRADILFDSSGVLKTPKEKEKDVVDPEDLSADAQDELTVVPLPALNFDGFALTRTIVRRFIPRNQKWDAELDQTCHFYSQVENLGDADAKLERCLLIYLPHFSLEEQVPFYHPAVRALGFLYEFSTPSLNDIGGATPGTGSLSLHFVPFASGIPESVPNRLERTFLSLLSTQVRLARSPSAISNPSGSKPTPFKDNIVPQHILQKTYVRLKDRYASNLIQNWAEVTEPTKYVFEDIAIAAFLIELWRIIYDAKPPGGQRGHEETTGESILLPGFVDIACGNGVLVYLLHAEGYRGWGFDARRRKSWSTYPLSTQDRLKESICIPAIFQDAAPARSEPIPANIEIHNGIFEKDTFIISNHADELTIWTPLLGALTNPTSPLPFLAIPCCSHSISGARFRYPPPKKPSKKPLTPRAETRPPDTQDQTPQPSSGDLKALRATKLAERDTPDLSSSAYGALTAKTMSIAAELGYDVDKTLMRIPSTRNIGVVGGLKAWRTKKRGQQRESGDGESLQEGELAARVREVVEREVIRDGGLEAAAGMWIERSLGLHRGKGSGRLKAGSQHG